MANVKISSEEYKELLEAKSFADDIVNILNIRIERSDNDGLVSPGAFGSNILPLARSYKEKKRKHKF